MLNYMLLLVDYGKAYPQGEAENLGLVSYAQLKSGEIEIQREKNSNCFCEQLLSGTGNSLAVKRLD